MTGAKAGLDQLAPEGRRVLLRVDFNVPLTEKGQPRDDARIRAAVPTIEELRRRGAALVLMTHLGRPGGRIVPLLSTRCLVAPLERLLGTPVAWVGESVGPEPEAAAKRLHPGQVLLLENLRFHEGETANDPDFARQLARLGDVYVDDAFGAAHRSHASTEGLPHLLPAFAGRLLAQELGALTEVVDNPVRPLVAIVGGSKLSTKLALLEHLLERVEGLLLGGAMAATFLKAAGREVGTSLVEDDLLDRALDVVALASRRAVDLQLPLDALVAPGPGSRAAEVRVVAVEDVPPELMILDIGPETVRRWGELVAGAGTVVWNGPLGLYENPLFAGGTGAMARAIAGSAARSVTGGGDLQAAIGALHLEGGFDHVSTGGGATLEFLEGRILPGVAALPDLEQVASAQQP
ncbi:MAG: phosphoglycerate kinase [Candidatus Dormibacteria bacterium]